MNHDDLTRQPLDYPAPLTFMEPDDYQPLPGIALILGIAASLLTIGAGLGWWLATRGGAL